MPILSNPKHERFAHELAKGMNQTAAYTNAGYAPNAGAASRMAASPKIVDRVSEIKHEIARKMEKALTNPDDPVAVVALHEMGLTLDWCAKAYQDIYDRALDTNQLSAANTAVANIQKIIEIESSRKKSGPDDDAGGDRIKVSDALALIREMRGIAVAETRRDLKDVTPAQQQKEREGFAEDEDTLLLPDLGDFLDEE